jgi:hypothetical protein
MPPDRRPGPAAAPTLTGPLATRRQRPRRRNTPNTNTTTTTTISTHNHVSMAASSVGAKAGRGDATAAHPSKQLGHRQTTPRARIDGRATRQLTGPCTPRPAADLGWPGRCQPSPAADHAQAPAGPRSVCPAWVGEQSKHGCADAQWQTPRRRRRTDGAGLRRHPNLRRGRLHRPALPIQPRSTLRDPPRLGPTADNSAAATPALSCRDRSSAQHGHSPQVRPASRGLPPRCRGKPN